jgi:hypothetical protein
MKDKMNWLKKDLSEFSSLNRDNFNTVKNIAVLQLLLILLTSLILDGGMMVRVVLLSSVGWWVGVLIILLFHSKSQTKSDALFLKVGYLLLILISYLTLPFWGLLHR